MCPKDKIINIPFLSVVNINKNLSNISVVILIRTKHVS